MVRGVPLTRLLDACLPQSYTCAVTGVVVVCFMSTSSMWHLRIGPGMLSSALHGRISGRLWQLIQACVSPRVVPRAGISSSIPGPARALYRKS